MRTKFITRNNHHTRAMFIPRNVINRARLYFSTHGLHSLAVRVLLIPHAILINILWPWGQCLFLMPRSIQRGPCLFLDTLEQHKLTVAVRAMFIPRATYFTSEGHVYSSRLAYSDSQVSFSYCNTRKVLIIFWIPPSHCIQFMVVILIFQKLL